MKIIFASTPVSGHLNPLLGIARDLIGKGNEVVVYTGTSLRRRVESSGARFHPLPAEVDFDLSDVDAALPERRALPPGPAQLQFDFENIFLGTMAAQYRGLKSLLDQFPADVIVTESLFYGAVPFMRQPRQQRPAVIGCGTTFLQLPCDDGAPFGPGLPYSEDPEVIRHYREEVVPQLRPLIDILQTYYATQLAVLGFDAGDTHFTDVTTRAPDIFWQGTVPDFEYPRAHLPSSVHFVGALPHLPADVPLPAWAADLDGSRKVVFVTQGTVANEDFNTLVLPTIRALADRPDILVVATGGGRDTRAVAESLPANARIADYLPLDWLLPKVDVMVTNGGYGTVSQALSAGVPLIVAGTTEDKPEVAARVEWAEVGINLKVKSPDEAQVRDAVLTVLQTGAYAVRARRMAGIFASYDSLALIREDLINAVAEQEMAGH